MWKEEERLIVNGVQVMKRPDVLKLGLEFLGVLTRYFCIQSLVYTRIKYQKWNYFCHKKGKSPILKKISELKIYSFNFCLTLFYSNE